ncbi:MAG: MFS transporter, partial [Bdellovibrionales bacterium]|nr:MFS transporter [Bdellovibrionales bacterium]
MMILTTPSKILLSRFLTRFGDQAWDFAIPLVLISLFPGHLQYVSIFYLVSKLAQFFINPTVLRWIDQLPRVSIYKIGIGAQTVAVITSWAIIYFFNAHLTQFNSLFTWVALATLALLGIVGSLGSTLMEISVGYDLAADILPPKDLGLFNSRLKRIDLITEVTSPLFAGLLLMIHLSDIKYIGFSLIALLNILTFIPEYLLLSSIHEIKFESKPNISKESFSNPISEFIKGFQYFKEPSFVVPMTAYAFLWLSSLSPHGVLLSGYLKDITKLSEFEISIFRGLGAFFGMIPTFIYPIIHKRWGLIKTGKLLLGFQALSALGAAFAFQFKIDNSIYLFLFFVLLSRIGLYGFS